MRLLLESVLDSVMHETSITSIMICLCVGEEVVEQIVVSADRRLEERSKRLKLASLKSMTVRLSFMKVGEDGSPSRGK